MHICAIRCWMSVSGTGGGGTRGSGCWRRWTASWTGIACRPCFSQNWLIFNEISLKYACFICRNSLYGVQKPANNWSKMIGKNVQGASDCHLRSRTEEFHWNELRAGPSVQADRLGGGGVGVCGVLQHWQWASECSQLEDGGDDAELPKGTFCGAINTLMAATTDNMRNWMSKNALSSIVPWLKTLFGRLKYLLFENERADLRSILVTLA